MGKSVTSGGGAELGSVVHAPDEPQRSWLGAAAFPVPGDTERAKAQPEEEIPQMRCGQCL